MTDYIDRAVIKRLLDEPVSLVIYAVEFITANEIAKDIGFDCKDRSPTARRKRGKRVGLACKRFNTEYAGAVDVRSSPRGTEYRLTEIGRQRAQEMLNA